MPNYSVTSGKPLSNETPHNDKFRYFRTNIFRVRNYRPYNRDKMDCQRDNLSIQEKIACPNLYIVTLVKYFHDHGVKGIGTAGPDPESVSTMILFSYYDWLKGDKNTGKEWEEKHPLVNK